MKALILTLYSLGVVGLTVIAWLSHQDSKVAPGVREAIANTPRSPGNAIPGLADIAGFVMAYRVGRVPVGRIAVLGFWWWIGWHFFAR